MYYAFAVCTKFSAHDHSNSYSGNFWNLYKYIHPQESIGLVSSICSEVHPQLAALAISRNTADTMKHSRHTHTFMMNTNVQPHLFFDAAPLFMHMKVQCMQQPQRMEADHNMPFHQLQYSQHTPEGHQVRAIEYSGAAHLTCKPLAL